MRKLKFEDVLCSICRGIYIEPVSLPCRHIVCLQCLERTIESNSLACPICRFRIGSYIRHAKGMEKLVNQGLWDQIKRQFPHEIEMKQNGEEDGIEDKIFSSQPRPSVVTVKGCIKEEFDQMLNNLKLEEEKTRIAQQEASEKLAKILMEEDLAEERDRKLRCKKIEEKDAAFIKNLMLSEKANESSASSASDESFHIANGRDSISVECRHFTPICVMPKTPPKLLPNGELRDTKILKPVNLATSSDYKRNFHPPTVLNKTSLIISSNNFLRTKPVSPKTTFRKLKVEGSGKMIDLSTLPQEIIKDQEVIQRRILQEKEDLEIAIKLHEKWNKKKSPKKRNHGYSLRSVKKNKNRQ